jgi:YidC/Oxa1 family membrane protein insertase
VDLRRQADMSKVINRFSSEDWDRLLNQSPKAYAAEYAVIQAMDDADLPVINTMPEFYMPIKAALDRKLAIENFFGIPLIDASGWRWPGILIPLITALTTFASSWIMTKMQTSLDEKQQMQQKIMMYVMPVMLFFMTVGLPAGVGVYWITSSVFQTAQQAVLNARAGFPLFKKKAA